MSDSSFETDEGSASADRDPSSAFAFREGTFSRKGRRKNYPDLASAPSIIATALASPYTATNEPKRGPFS
jgi:hypothetical protein